MPAPSISESSTFSVDGEVWNHFAAPPVASWRVPAMEVRIKSFRFVPATPPGIEPCDARSPNVPPPDVPPSDRRPLSAGSSVTDASAARRTTRTHFRPPSDVVKMHERLFYVLQPPLETLFHLDGLTLPFEPFPYQWEGIAFLVTRHAAILADEMGLGKTMQSITAIRLLLRQRELRSVLLVCPKPLVSNWQREFSRWAAEIPVTTIEGASARRMWQWERSDFPVKIANYECVVRDGPNLRTRGVQFDLVVLDEAQRIKNSASATNRVVRDIERTRSWALTGTPVENSVRDLVGICDFLGEGLVSDEMDPVTMGHAARELLIRRTKEQVLPQLPPKIVCDAVLDLTDEQRTTYDIAENEGVLRLSEMGHAATIQHVLELVTRLKQICNVDPATGESCKLIQLRADLEEVIASGRKVLVFSQWVETLQWLTRRLHDFRPLAYHGRVARSQRDPLIDQFQHDPDRPLMLMSYGCGGVGLNLQFSEYVFLYDRWWNPAVEEQAINRAHRIGSAGAVTVTRFVTRNTIEERIDEILREKRAIFQSVLGDAPTACSGGWNRNAIFSLFRTSAA